MGSTKDLGASSSDASPNGNTAIISNPSWTTGKNGSALAFNGVNTAVSIADTNGSLDVAALTVEAWVYKTGATDEYSGIIGRQTGTSWADLWGLFLDSAQFADAYRFCALDCVTGPSSTPDMNTWVHVAATEDGTTTRLYRNGVLVASSSPHSGSIAPDNTKVCIGSGANDASLACNSEFVNARIDDVRIYGRALSAAEIQADMNTAVASVPDTTAPDGQRAATGQRGDGLGRERHRVGDGVGQRRRCRGPVPRRRHESRGGGHDRPLFRLLEHDDRRQRFAQPDRRGA